MGHPKGMDRRTFIKLSAAAGAALASSALAGCRRAAPTHGEKSRASATAGEPEVGRTTAAPTLEPSPVPSPTARPSGQVALVRTDDRAEGVRRALDLLEVNPVRGKSLFLKPNLNSADPFPGSTHGATLRALAEQLAAMGSEHLTVGDRSGMGNTRAVMQAKGILAMAEELGWSTLVFDDLAQDDWDLFQPASSHWQHGFALPKPVLSADGIVQTCCLKTHRYGGHFTLSLKNSVGLAAKSVPGEGHNYMTELHRSPHQRRMIAEINSAYEPDLILLDGMEAFVSGGPARGQVVTPRVILAGRDRVAVDAVGVAILRHFGTTREVSRGSIFSQEQIARAAALGLGVGGPEEIEIITTDDPSREFAAPLLDLLRAE